jgi:hypothetical protein
VPSGPPIVIPHKTRITILAYCSYASVARRPITPILAYCAYPGLLRLSWPIAPILAYCAYPGLLRLSWPIAPVLAYCACPGLLRLSWPIARAYAFIVAAPLAPHPPPCGRCHVAAATRTGGVAEMQQRLQVARC